VLHLTAVNGFVACASALLEYPRVVGAYGGTFARGPPPPPPHPCVLAWGTRPRTRPVRSSGCDFFTELPPAPPRFMRACMRRRVLLAAVVWAQDLSARNEFSDTAEKEARYMGHHRIADRILQAVRGLRRLCARWECMCWGACMCV
jgi:hypothetical protein